MIKKKNDGTKHAPCQPTMMLPLCRMQRTYLRFYYETSDNSHARGILSSFFWGGLVFEFMIATWISFLPASFRWSRLS